MIKYKILALFLLSSIVDSSAQEKVSLSIGAFSTTYGNEITDVLAVPSASIIIESPIEQNGIINKLSYRLRGTSFNSGDSYYKQKAHYLNYSVGYKGLIKKGAYFQGGFFYGFILDYSTETNINFSNNPSVDLSKFQDPEIKNEPGYWLAFAFEFSKNHSIDFVYERGLVGIYENDSVEVQNVPLPAGLFKVRTNSIGVLYTYTFAK